MSALLYLDAVSRRYGALTAVDQITFTVNPADRLVLAGPNGAGKSTLLGIIDGTIPASSGRIRLDGADITGWPPHRRARHGIARVFQQPQLAERQTVRGNILLALRRSNRSGTRLLPPRPAVGRLLNDWALDLAEQTGLAAVAQTPAQQLSYGHRRQLDLAIALACQPRLLLLDEPTAGLSTTETSHITALLQKLPATLAVVIVEHDHDVTAQLATRTLHLDNGRHTDPGGTP